MAKTVNDLIEELKQLPGELIVGMSSDEEGNTLQEWSGDFSFAVYDAEAGYQQEFAHEIYNELGDDGETGDDEEYTTVTKDTATAIVLWP